MNPRRLTVLVCLALCATAAIITPVYSAYKGHDGDRDIAALLAAYPALKGTPADSCVTCHKSGDVPDPARAGAPRSENHCDYCHAVFVRDQHLPAETLNSFGAAYLAAGRDGKALAAVAARDTDGDGANNEAELKAGTNPGEAASHPGAALAPSHKYPVAALRTLAPIVEQTVFLNSTKSRTGDTYSRYRGYAAWALLQAIGISPAATSVDFLSADGYERTFTVDELKRSWTQGPPVLGLSPTDLGACGWVSYHAPGLEAGTPLPPATIMLAFEQDGRALRKATIDETGRITGVGPLRLIAPQAEVSGPDLGQKADPSCGEKVPAANRFNAAYDHNAGRSPSAIVAVRVRPLPRGTRDIDWQTPALRLLANEDVVVFGAIK